MQITIDTKHDSPAEIKKVIQLLQSLAGDSPIYSNNAYASDPPPMAGFFDSPAPVSSQQSASQSNPMAGLLSIFGDEKPSSQSQAVQPLTTPSQYGSGNETWQSVVPSVSEDMPKVVPYSDDPLGSHAQRLLDESKIGGASPRIKPLKFNFKDQVTEYY